jgi:hypothetical protein
VRQAHPDYSFLKVREDREVGRIECRYRGVLWFSLGYEEGPGRHLLVRLDQGIGPVPTADRDAFVAALRDSFGGYEIELA